MCLCAYAYSCVPMAYMCRSENLSAFHLPVHSRERTPSVVLFFSRLGFIKAFHTPNHLVTPPPCPLPRDLERKSYCPENCRLHSEWWSCDRTMFCAFSLCLCVLQCPFEAKRILWEMPCISWIEPRVIFWESCTNQPDMLTKLIEKDVAGLERQLRG